MNDTDILEILGRSMTSESKFRFLIVDDSRTSAAFAAVPLGELGHEVHLEHNSLEAINQVRAIRPDCLLLDLMMPNLDGFTILSQLRSQSEFDYLKVIVFSSKPYEADRNRAFSLGANGYINKVSQREQIADLVMEVMGGGMRVKYWGVRGTLPVPGSGTLRYGGNTPCITVNFPDDRLFIFDAGSGIRELSSALLASGKSSIKADLFISHPHWDHINALPYFVPLYMPGNEFTIHGPRHDQTNTENLINAQMDGVFFPVTASEFNAHINYRDLDEGEYDYGTGITVKTMLLNHPGQCLGYRIEFAGRSVCYITDNELYPEETAFHNVEYLRQLADFVRGTDILITDSTYTEQEYAEKLHWGHSAVSEVAKLADMAQVKELHLFHHDPEQDDDAIDAKLLETRMALQKLGSKVLCNAPAEGMEIQV